ncbi:MAG TPA: pyridoxal-phosphate dependent enzyme [Syntrophales bacterium]|nr:pyridoxal-phosphate dependent enzyme [Syntrophales bacterium]
MITLFERYPRLAEKLSRLEFGNFPTPVEKLKGLCHRLNKDNLYIKRDDLSSQTYGGNKVRKLEFLLADAMKRGAGRIITSGGAGSNHALATALYAKQSGLKAVLMLYQQPNSHAVQDNLLMDLYSGAKLFHHDTYEEHLRAFKETVKRYEIFDERVPYVIPLGGSSSVGAIGYVNAGFELAEQIAAGKMPLPYRIYLALGTMGTTAGLLLGLKAAEINVHLHVVRVVPTYVANMDKCRLLFHQTNELLRELAPSFPLCTIEPDDITIYHGYFGKKYGLFTREAMAAMALLRESDGIALDGTYTSKACAAFLENAQSSDGEPLLFWNTKNSRPSPLGALVADYKLLPSSFHHYFTEPVQPLDKESY